MKKLFSFLAVSFLTFVFLLPLSVFAATAHMWGELRPSETTGQYWSALASDDDGSSLMIGSFNFLFSSVDSGGTWVERQPGGVQEQWRSLASDADGSNFIAGSNRLYTSANGGVDWTERQPAGDAEFAWGSSASDDDGSNLIAAIEHGLNGSLYTSSNGGVDWTEREPAGAGVNKTWSVASDADGSNLIVGAESGRLYTSSDSGANWTERQPAGAVNKSWYAISSDADGSNLIAAAFSGRLYTSSDSGANWTERQPAGAVNKSWYAVSSDADGTHLVAAVSGGRVYSSDDSGVTWVEETPLGDVNRNWGDVISDADGTNFFLFAGDGATEPFKTPDDVSPYPTFTPVDDSTQVELDGTFDIAFNEDIATTTGNITLHLASDDSVVETIDIAGPKVTLSDTDTLTIDPTTTLELGVEYYFLAEAGIVEDALGNPFVGISDPTTWSFTSDALPLISSFTPLDNAVDVSTSAAIVFVFDQDMQLGTGNIVVKKVSDDSTVQTIDVPANYNWDGAQTTVSFNPSGLEYATEYYVLIDAGAFEDINGNPFVGISDSTTWNFTTRSGPSVILDTSFVTGTGFDYTVYSLTLDDAGKIVVGGSFLSYNGDDAFGIARLNTDGSLDDTFVTGDGFGESSIYFLAVDVDGKILVGGSFSSYNGDDAFGIARLNTDGSLDDTFVTGTGFDSTVYALVLDVDGKILVIGEFTTYNGDSAAYIARLNTDGSLDDTFVTGDGFDSTVSSLAIDADGKILVGGYFSSYNGDDAFGIARLNTDGSLDDTFVTGDGFDDGVYAISVDADGKILVGGDFSAYDGVSVGTGIARLNTDGSLDDTFATGTGFDDSVLSIVTDTDGKILVGGYFSSYNGDDAFGIARLNTDGSLDDTFGTGDGFDSSVNSLAIDDNGKILAGGELTSYNGDNTPHIARLIPPADEETPAVEESNGGGNGSSGSGGHRSTPSPSLTAPQAPQQALLTLLRSLIQQFINAGGIPSPQMLAFVNGPTTTPGGYTRDLDLNSEGSDVTALQLFLIAQNKGPQAQALAAVGATGFFGPLTQAALAEYQASVGITPAVGFFGPVTRAYINGL